MQENQTLDEVVLKVMTGVGRVIMSRSHNPYGDGRAAKKIAAVCSFPLEVSIPS